jgi:HTH-type transcriptional regulator / antitoxin HigA
MRSEIRPIRSEDDHAAALRRVEALWNASEGTPEGDELDVLITLIASFEKKRWPVDPPDPVEAILFRMESAGLTRKDLEPMIGSRARVAEVLNRKRGLSIDMIRRINAGLGIPLEILVKESRKAAAA